jgi:hypothetical protein
MELSSVFSVQHRDRVDLEATWERKVWFFLTLRQGSVGLSSQAEWLAVDWSGRKILEPLSPSIGYESPEPNFAP